MSKLMKRENSAVGGGGAVAQNLHHVWMVTGILQSLPQSARLRSQTRVAEKSE